jgi:hypothetical protein
MYANSLSTSSSSNSSRAIKLSLANCFPCSKYSANSFCKRFASDFDKSWSAPFVEPNVPD